MGRRRVECGPRGWLGPGELAGVPLDEGFGFRRDVEVLLEAGVRLADLEVLRRNLKPTRTPLAERLADREELMARRREFVVVPAPVGLGCRLDGPEPFELLESL